MTALGQLRKLSKVCDDSKGSVKTVPGKDPSSVFS